MSFNIELQGGKNYRLPVGGKYCPMDIDIAAIGATEGMFCWQKKDPNTLVTEDIGYANASSSLKITPIGGTYTVATTSAGGWGYNYISTKIIDTTEIPLRVTFKTKLSGQNMFIGFADTQATQYSSFNESLYLTSAGAINHQRKGAQVASYGSWTLNDTFEMEIYQGYFTVIKNGTQLFRTATALTNACFVADLYAANATYGDFTFTTEAPKVIGHVVDDDINAYPQDGYAEDGYYYVLVGATKPIKAEMKYAMGTISPSSRPVTVTGVGFRPYAVQMYNGTSYLCSGMCDASGAVVSGRYVAPSGNGAITFEVTDDGFSFNSSYLATYTTYTWYAIGI